MMPPVYEGGAKVVTAADEKYFDRLANLVGSVQFWSPETSIRVYDMGLSPESKRLASSWSGVTVVSPAWDSLPPHYRTPVLVAYKAWCLIEAMEAANEVRACARSETWTRSWQQPIRVRSHRP